MKPTPREAKLIHEKYDKVVKHLIDEKYAVDKESADKIIKILLCFINTFFSKDSTSDSKTSFKCQFS